MAMDATGREEPHDVDRFTGLNSGINRLAVLGVVIEITLAECLVNPRYRLIHNPARTQTHVAHFGVAHLPLGQAYIRTRARN